jgi:hypothetical protein
MVTEDRLEMLHEVTRAYIFSDPNNPFVSPEMMAGLELAPVEDLNGELSKLHKHWHVVSSDGVSAVTADGDPSICDQTPKPGECALTVVQEPAAGAGR